MLLYKIQSSHNPIKSPINPKQLLLQLYLYQRLIESITSPKRTYHKTKKRVFAAFEGNASTEEGVWTSPNGNGSWTRIAKNGTPLGWNATGRIVLANAPSNDNVIYALFENGNDNENGEKEADLWKYNLTNDTWTNYSSKLPDENGGDLAGNDPFSVQGGYDLVVSVKPDNENFVLIGGTGAYRIENIVNDATFTRIGGYASLTYANYVGDAGTDEHHADIHELLFNPHNFNQLFSGTDGGIHKSENITATTVSWKSLNNNYITYQFYHVAMDPLNGSDIVFGGAQDNGTNRGGVNAGLPNNTEMNEYVEEDASTVQDIYYQTTARQFLTEKQQIVYKLKQYGIQSILTKPEDLSINTVNKYLEMKSRGLI